MLLGKEDDIVEEGRLGKPGEVVDDILVFGNTADVDDLICGCC